MKINQTEIAKRANISSAMVSMILSGKKRPSWTTAKKLASVTGTTPVIWLDGTTDEIRQAISANSRRQDTNPSSQEKSNHIGGIL